MSELEDDLMNGSDAETESMTSAEVLKALEDVSILYYRSSQYPVKCDVSKPW